MVWVVGICGSFFVETSRAVAKLVLNTVLVFMPIVNKYGDYGFDLIMTCGDCCVVVQLPLYSKLLFKRGS